MVIIYILDYLKGIYIKICENNTCLTEYIPSPTFLVTFSVFSVSVFFFVTMPFVVIITKEIVRRYKRR